MHEGRSVWAMGRRRKKMMRQLQIEIHSTKEAWSFCCMIGGSLCFLSKQRIADSREGRRTHAEGGFSFRPWQSHGAEYTKKWLRGDSDSSNQATTTTARLESSKQQERQLLQEKKTQQQNYSVGRERERGGAWIWREGDLAARACCMMLVRAAAGGSFCWSLV